MRKRIQCVNCSHTWEQDVAETALRAACPQCGTVLDLTRAAQSVPGLSDQDKALIGLVGGVAIVALLINLFSSGKKKKRRR